MSLNPNDNEQQCTCECFPYVTIGVVCRNEKKHIAETLIHLLQLNYPKDRYEIIVVDGDSTDGTYEIAKKVLDNSNIKHRVVKESEFGGRGLCFARNLVVKLSRPESKYIAFTDADCIVEQDWLKKLVTKLENAGEDIAGVGGPRYIAPTSDKKELVINALMTSFLATAGNPAFVRRNLKYIDSIPNYNALYRKDILQKFPYDNNLISDDNEVNFRIRRAGYKFLYEPDARVYHHETNSIREFAKHMYFYGKSIATNMLKNRSLVRPYIPLTVGFLLYLLLLPLLYFKWENLILIPLLLYWVFVFFVFLEVLAKTKTAYSFLVFILIPFQHICYALGVLSILVKSIIVKKFHKKQII